MQLQWKNLLSSARRKSLAKYKTAERSDVKETVAPESEATSEWRCQLERDYDRLLFAAPTRRLADKTQVFPLDRNDSVRTRLTHSHEVANFARGMGVRLAFELKTEIFGDDVDERRITRDAPALLAAIGLAHDLGNPPFGHQGEAAMRAWFERNLKPLVERADIADKSIFNDFFKFDGNSQTFRLVTKLQILNDNFGLNLTCATLAALIKYPVSSSNTSAQWGKHGYFYSEREVIEDVRAETELSEGSRHPFTYLMEACDDIAYSILDAEDTVKKGFASYQDLINHLECWQNKYDDDVPFEERTARCTTIEALISKLADINKPDSSKKDLSPKELNDIHMQMFRVQAVGVLINAVIDAFRKHKDRLMASGCLLKDLISKSRGSQLCKALKDFDKSRGYRHRSVLELELRGSNYIQELMDMLWVGIHGRKATAQTSTGKCESCGHKPLKETLNDFNSPFGKFAYGCISENYRRVFDSQNDLHPLYKEAQLLADAISGMTDSYLMNLHDELKSLYEYESESRRQTRPA
jgi:dGTPase